MRVYLRTLLIMVVCVAFTRTGFAQVSLWKKLHAEAEELHWEEKNSDAAKVAKRALEVAEETFNPEHPYVAESLANLADIYVSQDKYEEAEPLYKRALAILETVEPIHLTVPVLLAIRDIPPTVSLRDLGP